MAPVKKFNKDTAISDSGTPKDTFQRHQPKVNPAHKNDPYELINNRDTNNEPTTLVNVTDEHLTE